MPKADNTPDTLRPYIFHGIDLTFKPGDKEAVGECPYCGRDGKFSVHIEKGTYRCFVCAEGTDKGGGNAYTMIRRLYEASRANEQDYDELRQQRKPLSDHCLHAWGVVRSIASPHNWLIPGFGPDGKLNQLYRWVPIPNKGMRLIPTPTLGHQLHGVNLFNPKHKIIYLCEGPWDAMALWDILRVTKESDEGFNMTSNPKESMLATASVLAVPGVQTFLEPWFPLFYDKEVRICYDSDHPSVHPRTGALIEPAGWVGTRRVCGLLHSHSKTPSLTQYIHWGDEGFDPTLDDGVDVRDVLAEAPNTIERVAAFEHLLARLQEVPDAWKALSHTAEGKPVAGDPILDCLPCDAYSIAVEAWRKALKWTEGLDHALVSMLATVISTMSVGDQLWIKVIGPASCGKSTLCEAVSVAKDYVLARSTMRGFHSGGVEEAGEDFSLVNRARNKTLVTKDGDTLLQAPNLAQILSEARDIYDTVSRTSYRVKGGDRSYEGLRMTWILCGTSSLRQIDSSELGERFLDCVVMEGIDGELEDDILLRVAHRSERNLGIIADGSPESRQEPELTKAMQLTGGYVNHLRQNAQALISQVRMSDTALLQCAKLGKFVAFMRARPSTRQKETAEREFGARLVSQHVRLAKCTAAVLNKTEVDNEVMVRVRRIAMDTGRGVVLNIAKVLAKAGERGTEVKSIALSINEKDDEVRRLLYFMRKIEMVELFVNKPKPGEQKLTNTPRWRMKSAMLRLYMEVMK